MKLPKTGFWVEGRTMILRNADYTWKERVFDSLDRDRGRRRKAQGNSYLPQKGPAECRLPRAKLSILELETRGRHLRGLVL